MRTYKFFHLIIVIYFLLFCLSNPSQAQDKIGIGTTTPTNSLDISFGTRSGIHASHRPLYVTGNLDSAKNGIEFRHSNGTQGIGFGYNTIYAAGSGTTQGLNIKTRGTGTISFYTDNKKRMLLDDKGRVTIFATPTGNQKKVEEYALQVTGAEQGISITVNGEANNSKNFITFWDTDTAAARGCIEGQTMEELHNSFEFIWNTLFGALHSTAPAAEAIACLQQGDLFEAGTNGVASLVGIANMAEYIINAQNQCGIAYESGGADYAEWIEKKNKDEKLGPGDIVGIKNGKVSKTTTGADHLMIMSVAPIILGNMPANGEEENFEKIAFMGQVPVKVMGKINIGDYILASGLNNGFGYGVPQNNMNISDYKNIVGVAWSASNVSGPGFVKASVGVNKNQIATAIIKLDNAIMQKRKKLAFILSYLQKNDPSFTLETPVIPQGKPSEKSQQKLVEKLKYKAQPVSNDFLKKIKEKPELLTDAQNIIKKMCEEKGIDISKRPLLNRLLNDPEFFIKQLEVKEK